MQSIPLTIEQRNVLKAIAWLTAGVVAVVIVGLGALLSCMFIVAGDVLLIRILIGLFLLLALTALGLTAWRTYNLALDARDGVALVHTARLTRKYSSARSPKHFYAVFDASITIQIPHTVWEPLEPGRSYLITYSPRSRIGWQVEPYPGDTDFA
ncbi:MAG: hypothetical protein RMK84_10865 [Oscillochloridaceae bacterium]|nr:hypothetical protein [Chloroflexaceae bacterium]MDW8390614.1 hypothetical protein [Oscillochloridaceae bacterium]